MQGMTANFNITSGFNSLESVHKLRNAGATELYGGFIPKEIDKKVPVAFQVLNKRGEDANFSDWNEFKSAIEQARKYDIPVYATFNGLYIESQYKSILNLIKEISLLKGIKGIILNDIPLLLLLKKAKYNKEIVISTLGTIFNEYTVQFYKTFGAKRIILDRQLSTKDLVRIIKSDPSLDYEIFGFGGSCFFIDGYCSFFHCTEKLDYKNKIINTYNVNQYAAGCNLISNNIINNKQYYEQKYKKFKACPNNFIKNFNHSCNLCGLYDLRNLKNISLKVVNRKQATESFVKVVKLATESVNKTKNKNEYITTCKKILKKHNFICNSKRCYYKEK